MDQLGFVEGISSNLFSAFNTSVSSFVLSLEHSILIFVLGLGNRPAELKYRTYHKRFTEQFRSEEYPPRLFTNPESILWPFEGFIR